MKRLMLVLFACLVLFPAVAHAQATVNGTFGWTAPTVAPSGIEIRLTGSTGQNPITFDCGPATNNQCVVPGITIGSWSAVGVPYNLGTPNTIKAYGPLSTPVAFTVPTSPAGLNGFKVVSIQITLSQ